ncbi:MAG: TIGR01212 family radical SAM protein [Eubacteriales bacterium]|nr:TIGR01212 family radical SAM protein [Eubacteriales bacterium]
MITYKSANEYYQDLFGNKIYKLALDGGFSCPNRDGTLGTGGCIFCSGGSGDFAVPTGNDVNTAIETAKALVAGKGGRKYIAYFQSYTCTYAPTEYLRDLYLKAIIHPDIAALSIGTRPDCLPDNVIALLHDLNKIKPVFIELGLQTIHPKTAEYIRRGYALEVYDTAVRRLKEAGINIIVHMIIGLPGETKEMAVETAKYIAGSGADGIKFQLLHVLKGTDLAEEYLSGKFSTLSLEEYTNILAECLKCIPPHMVVHRITGDGAKRDLIAPLWSADKKRVLNYITKKLSEYE